MGLNRDKLGFVRATGYGRIRRDELAALLELAPDEAVYRSGVDNGVRSGQVVKDAEVKMKPGDTFSAGPRVVKGSQPVPAALRDEFDGLRRSGFGGVGDLEQSPEGWRLRLRGLTLPGGVRTDALVLLPRTYPLAAPIGFYLARGAATAHLDQSHLFNRSYHGAPDLSGEGWQWYCGVADNWRPGHHTLVAYVTVTLAFFADRAVS
jgi:hypothetical protein